jgi:hypothetical protein
MALARSINRRSWSFMELSCPRKLDSRGNRPRGYKQTMTSMAAQPVPTQHPNVD